MENKQDKTSVLLVGGSSSVGQAVINTFENAGRSVLATHFSKQPVLSNPDSQSIRLDLTHEASVMETAAYINDRKVPIDIAIFLSGLLPGKNLTNYSNDEIDAVLQVNFSGQAKLIKAIQPSFSEQSHLIMISSISAQRGSFDPIYAAAKGAIISFVKSQSLAMQGRPRVNAIMPGLIQDSTMFYEMAPEIQNRHIQNSLTGALLKIDDLANIIFDLCKPNWVSLNGACIPLNGGAYV